MEELCGKDFPAAMQEGRALLLASYDAMDPETKLVLLKVAKGLLTQSSTPEHEPNQDCIASAAE
jgi:hypothetical protein